MSVIARHRVGHPAPLIFHLGAAAAGYGQGLMAAPMAGTPQFPWHPDLPPCTGSAPPQADVATEAAHRLTAMLAGIRRWQAHPYRRTLADPPEVMALGSMRLLDYGQTPGATAPNGPVVVVVPSLINRAYVLDLTERTSLLRHLAAHGLRPLLVDWGDPGPAERAFGLEDYLTQRLVPALALAQGMGGQPPALLGYCMGGTLCAVQARRMPAVRALVTIGAPWSFAGGRRMADSLRAGARAAGPAQIRAMIRAMAQAFGFVPAAVFQQMFAMIDPLQAAVKFRRFAGLDPDCAEALHFVALEDWVADGVAMAGPAAEQLLVDWHLEDALAQGLWSGNAAGPTPPGLVIAGRADRIAPPETADALVDALPGARHLTPELGHVGMIVGRHAPAQVWRPTVEFLRDNA
ncbi:MAG: alpha/beta fold hydrolase [Pseudomonadota bacterium]